MSWGRSVSQSMPKLAGSEFLPSRFTERGAAVPFTTPLLAQARVRIDDRKQFELMIPAFAGAKGIYAIRWRDLPEVFTSMTVHDRALHDAIGAGAEANPRSVRLAAMKVAASGLAGPEAARSARKFLADEENDRLLTTFLLVKAACDQVGERSGLSIADLASAEGQQKAKAAIEGVARRFGRPPNAVYAELEDWGGIVGPLGAPDSPRPARLRRLAQELALMNDQLGAFAEKDPSEARDMALFCHRVLSFTLQAFKTVCDQADALAGGIPMALRNWKKSREEVARHAERAAWTLDGWEFVLALWHDSEGREKAERYVALAEMHRLVPMVPEKEFPNQLIQFRSVAEGAAAKYAKALQGWQSGAYDVELIMRLERMKQSTVS